MYPSCEAVKGGGKKKRKGKVRGFELKQRDKERINESGFYSQDGKRDGKSSAEDEKKKK